MMRLLIVCTCLLGLISMASAQNALEGIWYNTEKSGKIEIYQEGPSFFGEIVWLEDPLDEDGKPKVNENSKNAEERNDPIIGLLVLKNFKEESEGFYTGGTIYDPENGKTYKCKLTLQSDNELDVRGYIAFPALGRTEHWTRVE